MVQDLVREYVDWLKPEHVRGILLCESHKHTPEGVSVGGRAKFRKELKYRYDGPLEPVFHMNCLVYGLNECSTNKIDNNQGLPQFWKLLGCAA